MKYLPEIINLIWITTLFFLFTIGWGILFSRKMRTNPSLTIPIGFAGYAFGAYFIFYLYLISPKTGKIAAVTFGILSLAITIRQIRDKSNRIYLTQRDIWLPGFLQILITCFYLLVVLAAKKQPFCRFPFEGTPEMAIDDRLPFMFAERLWSGESPTPLLGGWSETDYWLSSDRPPLQTAIELSLRPWYLNNRFLNNYFTLSTLLQCLWLPSIYAFCRVILLKKSQIQFALFCSAMSGFFLFNSTFVWPKMLSCALMVTALALVFDSIKKENHHADHGVAATTCASLAFLSHGGIVFSIISLPCLPTTWSLLKKIRLPGLLMCLGMFILLYAPWSMYQKKYDPPGNRLLKWHLAGVIPIDARPVYQTIKESYQGRPLKDTIKTWTENVQNIIDFPIATEDLSRGHLREFQMRSHLATLGFLSLGWIALLAHHLKGSRSNAADIKCLTPYLLASIVFWVLIIFIPGGTIIVQGSYACTALLFLAGTYGISLLPKAPMAIFALLHAASFWWIWLSNYSDTGQHPISQSIMTIAYSVAAMFTATLFFIPTTKD